MQYYLIKTSSLIYQNSVQYSETIRSLTFLKQLNGKDLMSALITKEDNLGIDLNFDDYIFYLKSSTQNIRKPSQFARFSMSSSGLFINEEVKELITEFNLPVYELYKTSCEFKGKNYIYYWFRIHTQEIQSCIDFEHSKFIRGEGSSVLPNNYEQSKQQIYDYSIMGHDIEVLYIKKEIERYDFFFLSHYPHYYFVSERLKHAMERKKFKGMEFETVDWIKIID
jgi:hypothetical protein